MTGRAWRTGAGVPGDAFCVPDSDDNSLTITRAAQGPYSPAYRRWEWTIHGLPSRPQQVLADGLPLPEWSWDEPSHILSFASGQAEHIATH